MAECFNVETSTGESPRHTFPNSRATFVSSRILTIKSTQTNIFKTIDQKEVINHCSNFLIVQFTLNSLSHKGKPLPQNADKRCV